MSISSFYVMTYKKFKCHSGLWPYSSPVDAFGHGEVVCFQRSPIPIIYCPIPQYEHKENHVRGRRNFNGRPAVIMSRIAHVDKAIVGIGSRPTLENLARIAENIANQENSSLLNCVPLLLEGFEQTGSDADLPSLLVRITRQTGVEFNFRALPCKANVIDRWSWRQGSWGRDET